MEKNFKLTSDCFITPSQNNNDCYIAYFPLETLIFEINKSGAVLLEALKKQANFIANKENVEFLKQLELLGMVNGKRTKEPCYQITEKPQPESVLLMTSDRCNLNCKYCYRAAEKVGDNMSAEIAIKAIDEVFDNVIRNNKAVVSVGYHGGGEPTMNWNVLVKSFNYAKQNSLKQAFGFLFPAAWPLILPPDLTVQDRQNGVEPAHYMLHVSIITYVI